MTDFGNIEWTIKDNELSAFLKYFNVRIKPETINNKSVWKLTLISGISIKRIEFDTLEKAIIFINLFVEKAYQDFDSFQKENPNYFVK